MNPAQAQMIDMLSSTLGPRGVIVDPADIEPWLTDWRGRWHGSSPAILAPASSDEVVQVVRAATRCGVPLVPQGGNTSMVGGATPPADGSAFILSLRRMNRVRALDPEANLVVAEAGVILADLHRAAAGSGRRFPLTLGARGSATIGGLTATNAGGTQVLRFGTMRSLVAGVEAVLPDGSVHSGLSGLKKDNRGYNFDQLMIGSEGTLGVITAVALRLVPAVTARAVAWLGLASPADALAVLRELQANSDRIEGFEILPDESLQAALAHIPGTRAPLDGNHPWHALVEATADDGSDPGAQLEALLGPLLDQGLIANAALSTSEAQAEAFWRIRDGLSEAEKKQFGPATQHDISVPVDAMPAFMAAAAAEVERAFPGTHASGFGHLGDGNIHFHVRAGHRCGADWLEREGEAVSRLVHDLVMAAGGSISAEHGIGQMKRAELERLEPRRVHLLTAIKRGLDPSGLMNPGKLVCVAPGEMSC